MKKEILIISDNFNEYCKLRSILETYYKVSLRISVDEVTVFLKENFDRLIYVIIDVDDDFSENLKDYLSLVSRYELPYILIIDDFNLLNSYPREFEFFENNIISRQSIYSNLIDFNNNFNNHTEEFYYER